MSISSWATSQKGPLIRGNGANQFGNRISSAWSPRSTTRFHAGARSARSVTAMPAKWDNDWSVGVRVWVERAGRAVLGEGRLELLEGIERWHSISEAARRIRMSYRRAWILVQDMNRAGQQPLVEAAVG